jgi:hypothetical protein
LKVIVNNHEYTLIQLDVFSQFKLVRKLGPFISSINAAQEAGLTPFDALTETLSVISDEDAEAIIKIALGSVRRVDGNMSAAVYNGKGTVMQYSDISLSDVLDLTVQVVMYNLKDFFSEGWNRLMSTISALTD